ncbi:MAG: transposase [Bacteroidota bacterium]
MRVKVDSFVVETPVHFPTDITLLYDSARKCLDIIEKASEVLKRPLEGWRKLGLWRKQLRREERQLSAISGRGGANRAARLLEAAEAYLALANRLSAKVAATSLPEGGSMHLIAIFAALAHYQALLDKHIDLVRRRLIEGEKIPHADKLFSIFEPHTEWINKGKKHKAVELGLKVLVATDEHHFILRHRVMQQQQDVELALPIAQEICQAYGQTKLQSISFDRGFYSKLNYENLLQYAHQVILPKKGKPNQEEAQREAQEEFVRLRHQHSAVEANINQLEYNGLDRCPDKGIKHFKQYVALGVLAYNLHRIGKTLIRKETADPKPYRRAA